MLGRADGGWDEGLRKKSAAERPNSPGFDLGLRLPVERIGEVEVCRADEVVVSSCIEKRAVE